MRDMLSVLDKHLLHKKLGTTLEDMIGDNIWLRPRLLQTHGDEHKAFCIKFFDTFIAHGSKTENIQNVTKFFVSF